MKLLEYGWSFKLLSNYKKYLLRDYHSLKKEILLFKQQFNTDHITSWCVLYHHGLNIDYIYFALDTNFNIKACYTGSNAAIYKIVDEINRFIQNENI